MKLLKNYWPHIAGALALLLSYIQPGLLQYVGFQKLSSPHATLWGIVGAVLLAYHATPPAAQAPAKWTSGNISTGVGKQIAIAFFLLLFWPVALSAQSSPGQCQQNMQNPGCSPAPSTTGPQGPQGIPGPQGAPGPSGGTVAPTPAPGTVTPPIVSFPPVTTPSGYPFTISGMYSSSSGNATNNGMQNTIELSLTNHAPRGWAARLDMFGLNNPSGATLQIASGQYKVQASRLFKSVAPIWTAVDLGFHAGFGALKSSAGAMAFAAGAGASADYNITPFFFLRVLDFTYAYSRGFGNNGVILGNYESSAAGIGFKF